MHPHNKHQLRRIFREKRMQLSAGLLNELNGLLLGQAKQLDWGRFKTVHLFLPIHGNHEPDTYAIADWLRSAYPGLRLAVSRSDRETGGMTPILWDSHTVLKENSWKIPEPENGTPIALHEIDAFLVPLLVFDKKGNRIGYGKGFYDRFLSGCRPDAARIGLSLFDPIDEISDLNAYDIPLTMCLTPTNKWAF